jgi:alpha-glucosidase
VLEETLAATDSVGATPTWVLSNHDVVRTVTRLGAGGGDSRAGNEDPDAVDAGLGLDRARAALLAMLVLPGSAYLYQGEELGLPQAAVPPEAREDPMWLRGGGTGRDGCRVPLPWTVERDGPDFTAYGFSPSGAASPWLPQPDGWGELAAEAQQGHEGSTLELVRAALSLRHGLFPGLGEQVSLPADVPAGAFVVHRPGLDGPGLACVVACGSVPVDLAAVGLADAKVLLASSDNAVVDAAVQPDSAAWVATGP